MKINCWVEILGLEFLSYVNLAGFCILFLTLCFLIFRIKLLGLFWADIWQIAKLLSSINISYWIYITIITVCILKQAERSKKKKAFSLHEYRQRATIELISCLFISFYNLQLTSVKYSILKYVSLFFTTRKADGKLLIPEIN